MKYQLIKKDKTLNLSQFKKLIKTMDWKRAVRKSGEKLEYFYLGRKDTEDKLITVTIRPSLSMTVTEMFKTLVNDKIEYNGTSTESRISELFLSKLLEIVGDMKDYKSNTKVLEW